MRGGAFELGYKIAGAKSPKSPSWRSMLATLGFVEDGSSHE